MGLTNKQELFISHYLKTWNATQAALEAGYSPKTAYSQGQRLLKNVEIATAVKERIDAAAMSADEVLARLAEQGRVDYSHYLKADPITGRLSIDGYALLADGKGHLIKGIKETQYGQNIEFHDAQSALALLGRHHKLFTDKQEIAGQDGQPLTIAVVKMPVDEL